jgi:hypothetical protein
MSLRNNPFTREMDCSLSLVPGHYGQKDVVALARLRGVTSLALDRTRLVCFKIHFPKGVLRRYPRRLTAAMQQGHGRGMWLSGQANETESLPHKSSISTKPNLPVTPLNSLVTSLWNLRTRVHNFLYRPRHSPIQVYSLLAPVKQAILVVEATRFWLFPICPAREQRKRWYNTRHFQTVLVCSFILHLELSSIMSSFSPEAIPDLSGKVIFITGGELSFPLRIMGSTQ